MYLLIIIYEPLLGADLEYENFRGAFTMKK